MLDDMKFACSSTLFLGHTVENSIQTIKEIGYEGVIILLCDIPHAYSYNLDGEKISSILQ